jgi:uncharacterized protein (DUF486 family)
VHAGDVEYGAVLKQSGSIAGRSIPAGDRQTRRRSGSMSVLLKTSMLLVLSNCFMTFAWYGHLKNMSDRKWIVAALASWGIAFFEYLIQVPANRIGYSRMSLPQLKILQEVITLSVFIPFAVVYMKQPVRINYLWAGFCLMGAVYFIFKQ